ncbi:DUF6929 family protein [Pararhizobium antarcticum]|uniref:Uncharacterized protein n=1 Tax=Pararhizobium antarcticum TaxID=1798805 RepID=A0A657LLQ0_9HYPH|nr:hypothetical protein [Pararhizobium antarcticum]OJF89761.1 hypothetical protein AX760_24705 [Pararhizobium antarcticum]OJF90805.1 hypothetical protein AX761_22895 [Rhizobium sp. 58]
MVSLTPIRELNITAASNSNRPLHISAASGLVRAGSHIYVVADDELHLGVFSMTAHEPGHLIRLFDGALPESKAERKRQKPDLEALTLLPTFQGFPHGALLALGSGSRPNRFAGALLGVGPQGKICRSIRELDLSPILDPLHDAFAELNIEGALVVGDEFRLFQRGNKRQVDNAIIRYSLPQILVALHSPHAEAVKPFAIQRIDLGIIDDVPLCFTDATALPGGSMVFSAVAEDTDDAYHDGACVGAGIGIIDNNGHLLSFQQFDRPYKVEGISACLDGNRLDILLVTDADDPAIPSMLLSGSIEVKTS